MIALGRRGARWVLLLCTTCAVAAAEQGSTTYIVLDGTPYPDDRLKWASAHPVAMEVPKVTKEGWYLIRRAQDGQYYAPAFLNGWPVVMLIDTGATNTAVGAAIAKNAGIRAGVAAQVQTANGYLDIARTHGNQLTIGAFTFNSVSIEVNLNPNSQSIALLGMDILRDLELYQTKDGLMIRRGK